MSLVNAVGAGLWLPTLPLGINGTNVLAASDSVLLDADEEEGQIIGRVTIDGGGSKTFGTSGSKINWLTGASMAFVSSATLTVGVKKSTSIDATAGPAARATIGAAAFDVWKALVGGTDTLASTTAQATAMASGTPFTVTDGDEIAVCFHLDVVSGTQSIKVRHSGMATAGQYPVVTLVTTGPTYTSQALWPNVVLEFDDGTLGWIEPSYPFSVADVASGTIGITNINGNVFRVPYPCKIDALAAQPAPSTSAANFAIDLYSDPLGSPQLVEAITFDANVTALTGARMAFGKLTTPRSLLANTNYAIGVRQTTATAVTVVQRDVNVANHFKPSGMGSECYAAISTAGGAFAVQNSGKRRYHVWARVSALDNGVGGGGASAHTFLM